MAQFVATAAAASMPPAPGDVNVSYSLGHLARPAGMDAPTERTEPHVSGEWRCLVLLVDFPDYRWDEGSDPHFANPDSAETFAPAHFREMLFSDGSYRDPWAASEYTGSMRDFYRENSLGAFTVTGTVTEWIRMPHTYGYYCDGDGLPGTADDFGWAAGDSGMVWDLVRDAVNAANASVDFSQYDNDGNGVVDGLFVVHAGPGAEAVYASDPSAGAGYLWSHKWSMPQMTIDGVKLTNYTLEPEDGKIGVFCHEFGHELGLPDLYDPDGSSEGLGEWDVMASGGWCFRPGDPRGTCPSHFSAWSKARLGWITPANVFAPRLGQIIPPVETSGAAYRLWTDGVQTTEYFLAENRQNVGFDAGLTRRQWTYGLAPANGLVIYHVDDAVSGNSDERHKKIDVEEATPYWTGTAWTEQLDRPRVLPQDHFLANGNRGDDGDPWPGYAGVAPDGASYAGPRSRDTFDAMSVPNSNGYWGTPTSVSIAHIATSGVNVIADLRTTSSTDVDPAARPVGAPLPHALLESVRPAVARSTVSLTLSGDAPAVVTVSDARGRLVRRLTDGSATERTIRWDLRDDEGRRVPAAIYVVRVESEGRAAESRVCVIR